MILKYISTAGVFLKCNISKIVTFLKIVFYKIIKCYVILISWINETGICKQKKNNK